MKRIVLSGLIALTAAGSLSAALTKDFYAVRSVLSEGNWVKVGVEKTGVYEISYEALKGMGFSDPSKVSVYGRGGRVLPESFVSNAGVPILTDDLTAVKVLHEDGKIYFYGLGPEEVAFESNADYETGGYFTRKSNNIYSKRGYYFLTDSRPVETMAEKTYTTSASNRVDKGVSFVYHELDSLQNSTNSGQLFWGEHVGMPNLTKRTWTVDMPDATGSQGVMECVLYIQPLGYNYGNDGEGGSYPYVNYGFVGTDGFSHNPYQENTALYFAPHQPTLASIEIPGNKGDVFVEFGAAPDMSEYTNLDYWVVSYERSVPSMKGASGESLAQQLIAFPSITKDKTGQIELANPASLVVLDVTSATDPQRLSLNQSGPNGTVGVKNTGKSPVIVVFDKEKEQLQISGYEQDFTRITSQNLHAYKEQGADFVIITTPKFRPYAEEIAQLHRDYDGIDVIVATTEECYNEFSGGTPDPMAYRSFMRMLYFSDRKQPKNLLLVGPLYGDFRGLQIEHDPLEGIIAYQSPSISISRGAHNINDFYGMMSDKFRTDYYERNDVQVGVGILPLKFDSDARIMVKKIENYLKRDDHAYYLNRFTGIGGIGDDHTHDIQVRDIYAHIRTLDNNGTIYTPLSIDTYGNAEARKKFFNQLNEGCNMFSYFGHGAEQFLGKNRYFFNAGDVFTLKNKTLPFALFGGCLITNTDRGFRGLGETIVTSTPYGCIGSIVSARDTWSGQNFEFFKQFFTCLHTEGSSITSPRRNDAVTIGEVYAKVKNYSTYSNELAYQLMCDPALVIPVINRLIDLDDENGLQLVPGNRFKFTGNVLNSDGQRDTGFNGQVVVRLNEPEKEIPAGMIESQEDPKNLTYVYRDEQVSMTVADVKDGMFTAEIHVPSSLDIFTGQQGILYLSAYDPSTKLGAAGSRDLTIANDGKPSEEAGDDLAPVVESIAFDNDECEIAFTVSDDKALNLSLNPLNKGLYLYIDGKEHSEAHFAQPIMETDRSAYSKVVPLEGMTYGEHTARLKVKDAAGNSAEKEILFTYSPVRSKFTITRESESCPDYTLVRIEGEMPGEASLVVISAMGEEVWRGEFTDGAIRWDHCSQTGEDVPAGHYKAYLIETGTGRLKGHSEAIDIPVI